MSANTTQESTAMRVAGAGAESGVGRQDSAATRAVGSSAWRLRGACALCILLASCAQWKAPPVQPNRVADDAAYGAAVRHILASQVAAADGQRPAAGAAGIDGHAARALMEHYERSFREPTAQPGVLASDGGGGK